MVTQKFTNGMSEIRVESAVSLDDAKEHNFPEGTFSRYFIDGKPCPSPMGMVNHIISESHKSGKSFYPQTPEELRKMQQNMMMQQAENLRQHYLKLKAQYKEMNVPDNIMSQIDSMMKKIDLMGVRVDE